MFTIFEDLFLLAIDDEEGDLLESVVENLEPALAAGMLAELVLRKRIRLEEGHVRIVDPAVIEDALMDKVLFTILDTPRLRKLKYWINTLTYEKLCSDIGYYLVEKKVLARKKKRLLLVVPYGENSPANVSAKYEVKRRLREIVLAGSSAELPEKIQLALLYHCDLLTLVFTRGERKAASKEIKKLLAEEEAAGGNEMINQIIAVATRSLS
jgi:hypothetical protein